VAGLLPGAARQRPVSLTDAGGRYRLPAPRSPEEQTLVALGLVSLSVGAAALSIVQEQWVPIASLAIPLLLGSLLLTFRPFLALLVVQAGCLGAVLWLIGATPLRLSAVVVLALSAVIMIVAVGRNSLGSMGESMLIDLRDRLRSQSVLPALPGNWSAQAVMRSAGGAQFAGDFVVAAKTDDGHLLEVVVVDVSGKGLAAGTRALLLSGAFGGLLGALSPEGFMRAANSYLLRQDWTEGFATAAHLAIRLDTGAYQLHTAGHPPGVQLHSGSGRWQVLGSYGPALGLLEDADFQPVNGTVLPGDALMIFTDGLVETPERDFTLGIDKLLGEAESMARQGFEDSARRLLDRFDSSADDRALLFLHRR